MTALRWFLGITAVIGASGWIFLAIAAHDFRRSFGASGVGVVRLAALPAVLLFVLASVLLPTNRLLLHVAAAVLALAALGLAFVFRESLFVGVVGLAYLAVWFVFYRQALALTAAPTL